MDNDKDVCGLLFEQIKKPDNFEMCKAIKAQS